MGKGSGIGRVRGAFAVLVLYEGVVSFPFIIGPSFPTVLQVSWNFFFNFGKLAMMVIGEVSTVAV
jgi:hypothetical protein